MTMTAIAPEQIDIDLVFEKPFKASNKIVFELDAAGRPDRGRMVDDR